MIFLNTFPENIKGYFTKHISCFFRKYIVILYKKQILIHLIPNYDDNTPI